MESGYLKYSFSITGIKARQNSFTHLIAADSPICRDSCSTSAIIPLHNIQRTANNFTSGDIIFHPEASNRSSAIKKLDFFGTTSNIRL